MSDIIDIIVTAIVNGAKVTQKANAEPSLKQAYATLQQKLQQYTDSDAMQILSGDASPQSWRAILAGKIGEGSSAIDSELIQAAHNVLDKLVASQFLDAEIVGVDVNDVRAKSLRLSEIITEGGEHAVGVKVQNSEIDGDIEIEKVQTLANSVQAKELSPETLAQIPRLYVGGNQAESITINLGSHYQKETKLIHVNITPKMEVFPTAIADTLRQETNPLVEIAITAKTAGTQRIRTTCYIEGYSTNAVDTVEIHQDETAVVRLLPTLYADARSKLTKLTRSTVHVIIEDLRNNEVEIHKTLPIWLADRNTMLLAIKNPTTGKWEDCSRFCGVYVTPFILEIMDLLRIAVEFVPKHRFVGYSPGMTVREQVAALYQALKDTSQIRFVNSVASFYPDENFQTQRVRLPSEVLIQRQANGIDGVLLFASLLETISLNPAIVLIPGHALLAWETAEGSNRWDYLETTILGDGKDFDEACTQGEGFVQLYEAEQKKADDAGRKDQLWFRRWSIHELRTKYSIMPME